MNSRNYSVASCLALAFVCSLGCSGSDDTPPPALPSAGSTAAGASGAPSAGAGGTPSAGAAGASVSGGGSGGTAGAIQSGGSGGSAGAAAGAGGGESTVDPGSEGDGLRVVNKPFTVAPETEKQDGVPHGKLFKFSIAAGSSQRFPKAPNREVNVYVPTQYVKGTPAPVIVVQDGNNYFGFVTTLSNTLDNLIAQKKLPPIVAVFANNGGGDAQGSERGLEYDTLSGKYAEWIDQELLPRVEQETTTQVAEQAVTFTKDPEGRALLGGSSGGIASFIACWFRPDLFRRAVGYSASFVAQESPKNPMYPYGAWNFHEDGPVKDDGGIINKTSPNKPIRVWLEAGTNDNNSNMSYPQYDIEYGNRRSQEKMAAKGYHVHLDIGTGAGHVDGGMIKRTLPEAMLWVWRGYIGGK